MTRSIAGTEVDTPVSGLVDRADIAAAAPILHDEYRVDIFGFLVGELQDVRIARTLYVEVVDRVAAKLPTFQWRCSPRVWLYFFAPREPFAWRKVQSRVHEAKGGADTERWRHSVLSTVIGAIRQELTEEKRKILILRLGRLLDWQVLAITQLGENAVFAATVKEDLLVHKRIEVLINPIQSLTTLHLRLQ